MAGRWDLVPVHLTGELGWAEKDSSEERLVGKLAGCPGISRVCPGQLVKDKEGILELPVSSHGQQETLRECMLGNVY